VRPFRERSGNAGMAARELPSDEVLASWQHVEQRALDLRAAGLPGSLRQQLDDIYAVARAAASAVNGPGTLPPAAAFGTAVADIMLHGRPGSPDPEIAAKLATTDDHVLLTATRSPAPRLPGDPLTARSP